MPIILVFSHFDWEFLHRKCDFVISLFRLTTARSSWITFYQNIYSLIAFFRVQSDKRLEESKSIREITVISKRKQQFCHWYCPGIRLQINQTKKRRRKKMINEYLDCDSWMSQFFSLYSTGMLGRGSKNVKEQLNIWNYKWLVMLWLCDFVRIN